MRPHPSTHTARETAFWFFVALKELEMEERNLQKKCSISKLQLGCSKTRNCNCIPRLRDFVIVDSPMTLDDYYRIKGCLVDWIVRLRPFEVLVVDCGGSIIH